MSVAPFFRCCFPVFGGGGVLAAQEQISGLINYTFSLDFEFAMW